MFSIIIVKVARDQRVPGLGAHHPEPPSPIQTLYDNLCAYLSIFRKCGALRFVHTICYTVQYNRIQHSTLQLNTTHHNTMH